MSERRRTAIVSAILVLALAPIALATSDAMARDALPDPTEPPPGIGPLVVDAGADPQAKLDLTAIFFAADRRVAIINDQRVQEGGTIGTARILEIEPNRVRVLREGEELALELIGRGIKRDPGSAVAAAPPDASGPSGSQATAPPARADTPDADAEAGR